MKRRMLFAGAASAAAPCKCVPASLVLQQERLTAVRFRSAAGRHCPGRRCAQARRQEAQPEAVVLGGCLHGRRVRVHLEDHFGAH